MDIIHWDMQLGTLLLAGWISVVLYTITLIMAYRYYKTYEEDGPLVKLTVAVALLSDAITVISTCVLNYLYGVTHWGQADFAVSQPIWMAMVVACTAVTSLVSQLFLLSRIVRLTKDLRWTIFLVPCCLSGFVGAIGTAVGLRSASTLSQRALLSSYVTLWLAGSAGSDILLSASLVILLRRLSASFDQTDSLIHRITSASLKQGILTSGCAIAALLSFQLSPATNVDVIFSITLGRVASLTLLSNLCSRRRLRDTAAGGLSGLKGRASIILDVDGGQRKNGGVIVSRHVVVAEDMGSEISLEITKAPSYTASPEEPWDNCSRTVSSSALV